MLGYISSTRKKSCYACVKAKRRCDLGYPFCKRCFVKGLDCRYPNAQKASSVRHAEVVIRQSTPDIIPPSGSSTSTIEAGSGAFSADATIDASIDPLFWYSGSSSSDESGSSPENRQTSISSDWNQDAGNEWNSSDWNAPTTTDRTRNLAALASYRSTATPAPRICRRLLPHVWLPVQLTDQQSLAVVKGLRSLVPEFAYTGATHFVHQNLYLKQQPSTYQDCIALSALYVARNSRTQSILANSINSKISALISTSSTWTIEEHLAAVQALIIYQCIRLFDPALNLQAQAEKHNALLELWSAHLWKRFFNEKPSFDNSHDAFAFNESLRRTVLMSVFMRCGWSLVTKGGMADQVPVLARLPLTRDLESWAWGSEEWNGREMPWVRNWQPY